MRSIRFRDWTNYYADRWQVDHRALMSETYGANFIPMPSELARSVALLHEIARYLDALWPVEIQPYYWHLPANNGQLPRASAISMSRGGFLRYVRDELREAIDLNAIDAGTFGPGVAALEAAIRSINPSYQLRHAGESHVLGSDTGSVQQNFQAPSRRIPLDCFRKWLPSHEVGELLGAVGTGRSRLALRLKSQRKLLGVCYPENRSLHFPPCQFQGQQLLPVVEEVLGVLPEGSGSGWLKAFWLHSPNLLLEDRTPAELLSSCPSDVVVAAKAFVNPPNYFGW